MPAIITHRALLVALAWWAALGAHPPACVQVRTAALPAPIIGLTNRLGGCRVTIARELVPARTRPAALRLCWAVIHELGHTLGLPHDVRGVMVPIYRPGQTAPGICWSLRLPARI